MTGSTTTVLAIVTALTVGCGARTALQSEPSTALGDAGVERDVAAPGDVVPAQDVATTDLGQPVDLGEDVVSASDLGVDVPVAEDLPSVDVRVDPPFCGDGRTDPGEECDLGAVNATVPAFTVSQPGRPAVVVGPLATRSRLADFYAYRSASAHTGFERVGLANVILHQSRVDQGLGLVFLAGVDGDDGGALQPDSRMDVVFRGVPSGAMVAVSDDEGECQRSGSEYRGSWTYQQNTDGCAIGPLPWDSPWTIVIEPNYRDGVTAMRFVGAGGVPRDLLLRSAVVIEHRTQRPACRHDCRRPRCGDGFLDVGERCDDGNTVSGDGCPSTCASVEP